MKGVGAQGPCNSDVEAQEGCTSHKRGPLKVLSDKTKVWVKGGRFSPQGVGKRGEDVS